MLYSALTLILKEATMSQIFSLNQPLRSLFWTAQNRLVRETILILTGILLIALSAQFVIPLKPVPLTFQSATVILIGMVYGARLGTFTLLGYLIAGGIGLPVFADMASGLNPLMGPTVGYLAGFVPAALLGGFLAQRGWARHTVSAFIAACLSAAVIFFFGLSVLSHFVGWNNAFALGLAPFMFSESLKLFAIALIVPRLWKSQH
jgi:biotin transport system substrate-specific component